MSNEFTREERYIVFKVSDLGNSLKGDEIRWLAREYAEQRRLRGKEPLECVVVEKDWPEYEPTWRAIEVRVTGTPDESVIQTAARILNINLILERDALRAKIAEMERQEPVWFIDERGEPKRYHKSKADYCKYGGLDLLYALPGAKGEEK